MNNLQKIEKNIIVKEGNTLVNAIYKLNINEQKILYRVISNIHMKDKEIKDYKIKTIDLIKFIGTKSQTIYKDMQKYTQNLFEEALIIQEKQELIQTTWFSYIKYTENNEVIVFRFQEILKPYLLNLQTKFTSFNVENIRKFKSRFSPKIYILLKQLQKKGYREFSLEELRIQLCVGNSYQKYTDFKRDILLKAQKEINEFSDIFFEFEEIKQGKKVVSIIFKIRTKKMDTSKCIDLPIQQKNKRSEKIILSNNKINEIKEKIDNTIGDNVSDKKIISWIKGEKEEEINFYLEHWSKWDYKTKASKSGFFIDLVDKNRPLPSGVKGQRLLDKPIQATNYEQRQYDDDFFNSLYDNNNFESSKKEEE